MKFAPFAVLFTLLLASCQPAPSRPTTGPAAKTYTLHGKVLSVDLAGKKALIDGQNIPGWMEAMAMEYPVQDEAELKKLQAGRSIVAKVNVNDLYYWLSEIRLEPPQKAQPISTPQK